MTWWADRDETEGEVTPFTVVLSVGTPTTLEVTAEDAGERSGVRSEEDYLARHWLWQEGITALLHAVFARGGTVVSRYDEDLFPILWATARIYAEGAPAEHGTRRDDAPLVVLADRAAWAETREEDSWVTDSIREYEATGAVRVLDARSAGDTAGPGPGRNYGMVLWPDRPRDDLAPWRLDGIVVIPDERGAEEWGWADADTLRVVGDTPPPLQLLFEQQLDDWLGAGGEDT